MVSKANIQGKICKRTNRNEKWMVSEAGNKVKGINSCDGSEKCKAKQKKKRIKRTRKMLEPTESRQVS